MPAKKRPQKAQKTVRFSRLLCLLWPFAFPRREPLFLLLQSHIHYDTSASSVVESLYTTLTWKPPGEDHGSKKRSPLPDAPDWVPITQLTPLDGVCHTPVAALVIRICTGVPRSP